MSKDETAIASLINGRAKTLGLSTGGGRQAMRIPKRSKGPKTAR